MLMKKLGNNKNRTIVKICLLLMLVLIIIQPNAALHGAKTGLLLWFNTVLPTLLPFIILSNFIIRFQVTDYICYLFSPVLKRIFHVSDIGCYPIIIGILSGYPMGAKTCADLIRSGQLSQEEGQYIMILVGNASYMFLTSFLAVSSLRLPERKYQFLLLIYLSSMISATIFRISYRRSQQKANILSNKKLLNLHTVSTAEINEGTDLSMTSVDHCILDGFTTIFKIGGYIIMFSVLTQILSILLHTLGIARFFILGSLEITTGIYLIVSSSLSTAQKIVLSITITSFGGFSSFAQVGSVIEHSGLSLKIYLRYKLLSCLIACVLSILFIKLFFIL